MASAESVQEGKWQAQEESKKMQSADSKIKSPE
jgi:hypothetical protein